MKHTTSNRVLKLLRLMVAALLVTFVAAACNPSEGDAETAADGGVVEEPLAEEPLGEDPLAAEPIEEDPLAGGEEDPLAGGGEDPLAGGAEDPLAGGDEAERAQEQQPTFADFDADGDGAITEEEFTTAVDETFGGQFDFEFTELDTDGDGSLTEEEFSAVEQGA